jgi:hypothetical protein
MPMTTKLISVTIVYCQGKKQFKKEIDLGKVGGLWWQDGNGKSKPKDYPPGTVTPLNQDCDMQEVRGGGPTACWWDGSAWICPDGLG